MKKINDYADACADQKIKQLQLSDFDFLPNPKDRISAFGEHKLITWIRSLNDKWETDWTDDSQRKYFMWFLATKDDTQPTGVRFSFCGYVYDDTFTVVGSRLCCASPEIADYLGNNEKFLEYWAEYQVIPMN